MSNFYAYPAFKEKFGDQIDENGDPLVSAQWQTIIMNCGQVSFYLTSTPAARGLS